MKSAALSKRRARVQRMALKRPRDLRVEVEVVTLDDPVRRRRALDLLLKLLDSPATPGEGAR